MWQLGEAGERPEWEPVETPFDETLFGVAQTVEGPYAVGTDGTLVGDRGNGWEVVFNDGPATRENQLRAIAATDDGERIWLLGSSGAMACYDVTQRKKFDYSYPGEMTTTTWEGITVAGQRGSEKALAANGSGEILPFALDGFDVDWGQLDKPGDRGSTIAALAATPDGVGFAVDTSGNAFRTSQEEGWEDVGVVDAQVEFYDVSAGTNQSVYVAAGDGRIYRYDDSDHDWTPIGVADAASLRAIDVYEREDGASQMVVMGSQGTIYRRRGPERWEALPSPTSATLHDLRLDAPDVAVGRDGTVIQRPRGEPRNAGPSPDGDEFDGCGENFDGDDQNWDPDDEADSQSGDADSESDDPDEDEDDLPDDGTDDEDTDSDDETADSDDPDDEDDRDDGVIAGPEASSSVGVGGWNQGATGSRRERRTRSGADTETKEAVLVTLAERTNLDGEDLEIAVENSSDVIEEVLTEIAEEVGIDPARVRDALHRPAE